jgi:hypothetical protein
MIGKIEVSVHARRSGKTLSNPFSPILPVGEEAETYHDVGHFAWAYACR